MLEQPEVCTLTTSKCRISGKLIDINKNHYLNYKTKQVSYTNSCQQQFFRF